MNYEICQNPYGPDQGEEVQAESWSAERQASEEAARKAGWSALDQQKAQSRDDWDAVYRAAVCAAAQAIAQRNWDAKRQALSVAAQADTNRQMMVGAIFGAREVPAQYRGLLEAGRSITRAESNEALKAIAADKRQQPARRGR